jgi:hypothetical protein
VSALLHLHLPLRAPHLFLYIFLLSANAGLFSFLEQHAGRHAHHHRSRESGRRQSRSQSQSRGSAQVCRSLSFGQKLPTFLLTTDLAPLSAAASCVAPARRRSSLPERTCRHKDPAVGDEVRAQDLQSPL